jgi:hypothetical protein
VKSRTTSGSDGSGFEGEVPSDPQYVNFDFKDTADGETSYTFGSTVSTTISTWKKGNAGTSTSVLLPASSTGYLAVLQDLDPDTKAGCAVFDSATSLGQVTRLSINGGAIIEGGLRVTMKTTFPRGTSQPAPGDIDSAVVIWCWDDGITFKVLGVDTPCALTGGRTKTATMPVVGGVPQACYVSGTEKVSGKAPNHVTTWTQVVLLPHNGSVKISR